MSLKCYFICYNMSNTHRDVELTSSRIELFSGWEGPSYSASSTSDRSTLIYEGFSVSSYCKIYTFLINYRMYGYVLFLD